jgi:glycosyltransferase involved in cell wall biosynthesis
MPTISIVIRCYNEEEHIGRLLAGIAAQSLQDFEIILVDSGSTDATLSIARNYPVKIFHIAPHEFSFGRSLNRGCAAAVGETLVFASAHVYPLYDDWLERLVAPFKNPAIALSYGGQRGSETTKYSERQIFTRWFPPESSLDQSHPFCNNANAAVRRSLWQHFPFDEDLTGLEDVDWAKRVMQAGHKIAYASEAVVAHVHAENASRIFNRYRREALAFRQIFPEVSFTLLDFARLLITNTATDLYHAARDGVLFQVAGSALTFRLMQFWGTYCGHNRRGAVTGALKERFYYPPGRRRHLSKFPGESRRLLDYTQTTPGLAARVVQEAGGHVKAVRSIK